MNHEAKRSKGFTLIELMLAMMFISVLLIAIAMTVIRISSVYNRGVALKAVNQSARDIASDIRSAAMGADMLNLATDYRAVVVNGKTIGGRLCLGNYSYIWNTAFALQTNSTGLSRYTGNANEIHFVKVPDSAKIYCARNGVGALQNPNVLAAHVPLAQELINKGDFNLGISSFTIASWPSAVDTSANQAALYNIDYIISAGEYTSMNPTQTACKTPEQAGADIGYCNVQPFSMVIRHASSI